MFGDSNHKDHICYVSYSSVEDNIALIKDYFRYYCDLDYDKLEWRYRPPIDDYNCVMAILTYYFRNKSLRFEDKKFKFSRPDNFPHRNPEKATGQYKIWVDTI